MFTGHTPYLPVTQPTVSNTEDIVRANMNANICHITYFLGFKQLNDNTYKKIYCDDFHLCQNVLQK